MKTIIIDGVEYDLTPKALFKKGDWIYHEISGNTFHINKIGNGLYMSDEGATISLGRQNDWKIWTIQDAKEGDVLVWNDCGDEYIFVFDKLIKDYAHAFIGFNVYLDTIETKEDVNRYYQLNKLYPATKEQRDLLFQKMKEAGYEWDAEKKELKEIEQKPAKWSEEDENFSIKIKYLIHNYIGDDVEQKLCSWVDSLKERVQPQLKHEWNEEEKARIDRIVDVLDWAEDKGRISHSDWEDYVNYVQSLKPQPYWKPSMKQMKALDYYANSYCFYCDWQDDLRSLFNVLKNL